MPDAYQIARDMPHRRTDYALALEVEAWLMYEAAEQAISREAATDEEYDRRMAEMIQEMAS
jgi:hypothetical protein